MISFMEYMIASWSKKGPIKDYYREFPGLEKGFEASLTWTELIHIGGKNPVFKYFWSQVDKSPAWKRGSPLKYAQVIKSSEIEHSHHPNLRKASMKLAYW